MTELNYLFPTLLHAYSELTLILAVPDSDLNPVRLVR
jgi:hypothetical protein